MGQPEAKSKWYKRLFSATDGGEPIQPDMLALGPVENAPEFTREQAALLEEELLESKRQLAEVLDKLQAESKRADDAAKQMQAVQKEAEKLVEGTKAEAAAAQNELATARSALKIAGQDKQKAESDLARTKDELKKAAERTPAPPRKDAAKQQEEFVKLQSANQKLLARAEAAEASVKKLEKELTDVKIQVTAARSSAQEASSELVRLGQTINKQEGALTAARAEHSKQQDLLQKAQQHNTTLEADLAGVRDELRSLTTELEQAKSSSLGPQAATQAATCVAGFLGESLASFMAAHFGSGVPVAYRRWARLARAKAGAGAPKLLEDLLVVATGAPNAVVTLDEPGGRVRLVAQVAGAPPAWLTPLASALSVALLPAEGATVCANNLDATSGKFELSAELSP